ncbi:unnamed protein product [Rotaria magnacalcarata]|uniref:Uncharacterized protein n=3 Tax=Rotaria magnacalcarata TaxID=392030 RepID=A0A819WY47_9BILA|nr:unnamed protein product [Rotaria magnacalcarata]CAF2156945.1 unnamed protein product [Rotaria magnacalcarata]CAF4132224.1 unnamed protein product [Rotaria magnacalcarata]CAF4146569.1 unnamed protein product [Rotaria magnacalcarata]
MHSSSNGNNVDNAMHDTRKPIRIQLLNTKQLLFLIDLDELCGYMKHVNMNIGLSLENAVLNPRHLK